MKKKKKKLAQDHVDSGTSSLGYFKINLESPVEFLLSKQQQQDTVFGLPNQSSRHLGMVQRPDGKRRWWVADEGGNEHLINRFQITYQFPEDFKEKINVLQKKVEKLQSKILKVVSVDELWGLLLKHTQFGVLFTADDASRLLLQLGKIDEEGGIYSYVLYRIMAQSEKYFKVASIHGFYCRSPEEVTQYAQEIERREKEEKDIVHFVSTLQEILRLQEIGEDEKADEILFREEDIKYLDSLKEYSIKENSNDTTIANRIMKPLGIGTLPHNAFELLKKIRIFGVYENPHILAWKNEPLDVGEDEIEDLENSALQYPIYDDVRHLRKRFTLPVFSIADVSGAHRIGWSIMNDNGTDWIFLHVIDPTRYINPNTDLDIIFRNRVQSVNLPEIDFSLFPKKLEEAINFKIDVNSKTQKIPAISIGIKPERDGRIIEYKINYSFIDYDKIFNLNIDEANAIILGDETKMTQNSSLVREKHFQEWMSIEQFAERRKKYRIRHDAISLKIPKASIKIIKEKNIENSGHIFRIDLTPENENNNSVGILHEFDLVVGEVIASFCSKWDVPMIFKSQPVIPLDLDFKPTKDPLEDRIKQESLDKLYRRDRSDEKVIDQITKKKSLPPEIYSIAPRKHHGLALTSYAQFTNPLNDYYDLVNHYQLKYAFQFADWKSNTDTTKDYVNAEDDPPPVNPFTHNFLLDLITKTQSRKAEINMLQVNSTRFWIYWSIKNDVSENIFTQYEALVIVARDDRNETTVLLRHYELEAKMTTKRTFTKGEKIQVRVEHVDPFYDRLILRESKKTG